MAIVLYVVLCLLGGAFVLFLVFQFIESAVFAGVNRALQKNRDWLSDRDQDRVTRDR